MTKFITRYSLISFLIFAAAAFVWLVGAYFLFYSGLKSSFASYVNGVEIKIASPQNKLSDLSKERLKTVFADLDKSRNIVTYSFTNRDRSKHYYEGKRKRDAIFWGLNVTYPVEIKEEIVGWIKIWPSPELAITLLLAEKNLLLLGGLFLFLLFAALFAFNSALYLKFIRPCGKIKAAIRNIADGKGENFSVTGVYWQEARVDLNKINAKLTDADANLDALFQVSKALTSKFDINHVFSTILSTICKKNQFSMSAVFLPSESGILKIASKCGYPHEFKKSFNIHETNPVTDAFNGSKMTSVKNLSLYGEKFSKEFVCAGAVAQINTPITDENGNALGVLNVSSASEDIFGADVADAIATAVNYLSLALRNLKMYEKIYDDNRKLESEVNITSTELIHTNARLIRKVRDIKALSDISEFASARFDLCEISDFIIKEAIKLSGVESAGFLMENSNAGDFSFIKGAFSIEDSKISSIVLSCKNSEIIKEIKEKKQTLVFTNNAQLKQRAPEFERILPMSSAVFIPVVSNAKVSGIMICINKFGSEFSDNDISILEHIAVLFAAIAEKINIYAALEKKVEELSAKK
ncbi:GAF domain-containing protein [Endomicrobium proavitum]|uniref:GAF domain-containing protein n=1 Tax=Endomicrobium proavitum TaxID=1408281 RepID=A0A0G3WG72_9BACT|nr:GAF domain-containing protein [Endomicrobium proavitum]AKL97631.1 exported protein of unknown function [Endomicrobium proavitum]